MLLRIAALLSQPENEKVGGYVADWFMCVISKIEEVKFRFMKKSG